MVWCWLAGTWPAKTMLSVPRLTPLARARTSTSPAAVDLRLLVRISPRPGEASQKARDSLAVLVKEDALVEHILAQRRLAHLRTQSQAGFGDLESYVLPKGDAAKNSSGRQEMLENLINEFI